MITCDLIGRLGNQMFQIATTFAAAQRAGAKYGFPKKAIGSYTGEVYFPHLPAANSCAYPVYNERSHAYSPIPIRDNLKLHGYWQSAKYFDDYRDKVIELFQIKPFQRHKYSCSVHIRLTDYVQFKDKHPPVTIEYLDAAMRHIYDKMDGQVFFAPFSDDIVEAQRMIRSTPFYKEKQPQIAVTSPTDPKHAIAEMSAMEHNIIANSSFSWWGAWLNPNPDKIVIAPKQWFGPGNSNLTAQDIYCENWIVL